MIQKIHIYEKIDWLEAQDICSTITKTYVPLKFLRGKSKIRIFLSSLICTYIHTYACNYDDICLAQRRLVK